MESHHRGKQSIPGNDRQPQEGSVAGWDRVLKTQHSRRRESSKSACAAKKLEGCFPCEKGTRRHLSLIYRNRKITGWGNFQWEKSLRNKKPKECKGKKIKPQTIAMTFTGTRYQTKERALALNKGGDKGVSPRKHSSCCHTCLLSNFYQSLWWQSDPQLLTRLVGVEGSTGAGSWK